MIKKLFIAVAVLMCAGAAWAAKKCVKLDADVYAALDDDSYEYYQPDWYVTEDDGTVVRGVGVCSNQAGNTNSVSETITIGAMNEYCWCKMISPAVSKWVSAGYIDPEYYSSCENMCSGTCVMLMIGAFAGGDLTVAFRTALFGSVQAQ